MIEINPILANGTESACAALQHAWGRHPCVIRCPKLIRSTIADETFASFRSVAAIYNASPLTRIPFRVWVGNASVSCDVPSYLPVADDCTVDEYVRRIIRSCSVKSCFVMLNHLYLWDPRLWSKFSGFVDRVINFAGIPSGGVDFDVICGQYDTSGFGIHLDDADNCTFVLSGNRTIYTWSSEYGNAFARRTSAVSRHLSSARRSVGGLATFCIGHGPTGMSANH